MLSLLLIAGALGANLAFVGLGMVFDYPDVLAKPAPDVLIAFNDNQLVVSALFVLLAASAALLIPISRRLDRPGLTALGTAAALVQVIGLMRWPLIVPFIDDPDTFTAVSTVLGTVIGETLGYALTAIWTVRVAHYYGLKFLAYPAAGLVALGVLIPLGVPGTDMANFIGYILYTVWLVVLAVRVRPSATKNPLDSGAWAARQS
ncbi:DUF4386 domain-containing protein [Actinokineospora globicatena]|uniref:DUF4386 family protein n=1 Tax=Actinokineospora globicatena TaxID=103729 RepID=A0A9W6QQ39_9PSEU|nr:DUF4386 domain-containing protein [Actinokineospora globicatena]GLW94876.1 hypothetical protein Aglo03_56920 [Actinokineospora globicatena]